MKIGIMPMERGLYIINMKKKNINKKKDIVSIILLVVLILLGIFSIYRYNNYNLDKEKYNKLKNLTNEINMLEEDLKVIQELDSNIEKVTLENNNYVKSNEEIVNSINNYAERISRLRK